MNKSQLVLVILGVVLCSAQLGYANDVFCEGVANGRFVSNPRSCQHWFSCNNGVATEGICPGIMYIDVNMQMCRYPEYVDCQFDSVDVECPLGEDTVLGHPESCEKYVVCVNGFPRVVNCAPDLHWNAELGLCDLPEVANCEIIPDFEYWCDPSRDFYLTRHPYVCQKFIVCINGEMSLNRCANDLLFDPIENRCDLAANVDCNYTPGDTQYVCDPNIPFYLAPHPTLCPYFIICMNGNQEVQRCAPGLVFDRINNRCDQEANVVC